MNISEENELPLFKTFRYQGVRFLGVRHNNDGLHIVDERGNNYGVWTSVDKFREYASRPEGASVYGVNARLDVHSEGKK